MNEHLRQVTRGAVIRPAGPGRAAIDRRLLELHRAWDVERVLEANAATLAFTGCVFAATVDRGWVFVPRR